MGKSLDEIAQELKDSNKKVQLIYAFNGTGKTLILSILVYTLFSRMFDLMQPPVVKHSIAVA